MDYYLREWSFYFPKGIKTCFQNRRDFLKTFLLFINGHELHEIEVSGLCLIGGYGLDGNYKIIHSPICKLEKGTTITSDDGEIFTTIKVTLSDERVSRNVTKKRGSIVLNYSERSSLVDRMLKDAKNNTLSIEYGFYNDKVRDPQFV